METRITNLNNFIRKINRVEVMLNEIKKEASLLDKDFQKSIKRGEKDIAEGKVVVCKTKEELDCFLDSI